MEEEVLQRDLDSAARGSWKIREMENVKRAPQKRVRRESGVHL